MDDWMWLMNGYWNGVWSIGLIMDFKWVMGKMSLDNENGLMWIMDMGVRNGY